MHWMSGKGGNGNWSVFTIAPMQRKEIWNASISLSTDRITSLVKRHAACPKAEASLLPTESAKQNPLDDGNCLPQSC